MGGSHSQYFVSGYNDLRPFEARKIVDYLSYNKYRPPRQEVVPDRNNEPREKDKTVEVGGRSRSQMPEPSIHPCPSLSLLFGATRSYNTMEN